MQRGEDEVKAVLRRLKDLAKKEEVEQKFPNFSGHFRRNENLSLYWANCWAGHVKQKKTIGNNIIITIILQIYILNIFPQTGSVIITRLKKGTEWHFLIKFVDKKIQQ